jgi:cysteine-rich repeat protein
VNGPSTAAPARAASARVGIVAWLATFAAGGVASGQTVLTSSALDHRIRQVDVGTQAILAETAIMLEGAIVHGLSALASQPGTGTLFGVLREARCPGDASRLLLARGSCNEFTPSPTACAQAFAINSGVPVSCVHSGVSCAPCVPANEGPLGCTNECLVDPGCAEAGLAFAGNGGCNAFAADPATCVQRFAQSECGPVPCFVPPGGGCRECSAFAVAAGNCSPTCGPLASRDPVHLVTVDTATGAATSRGNLGDDVSGLVFACDGALFGVTGDARCRDLQPELVAIDAATAAVTPALAFPTDDGAALAYDVTANRLLRGSGVADEATLRAIDPATLDVTLRPLSGPATAARLGAIVWEPTTGALLWSHTGTSGPLFRVPDDGASVALGAVGRRVDGMAFAGPGVCPACGDGVVQGDEACDDGNAADGDCCTALCALDAPSTACTADADPCTVDACDATGTCAHALAPGLDGAACLIRRLIDPAVCAPDELDAKLGRVLRKRGGKTRTLVARAAANPARAAKKLRAARRQAAAIARALEKRRDALTSACAARLDALLTPLPERLGASG